MARPTSLLTAGALLGFAGNSVLCRIALADGSIDPVGFTAVRLVSGAALLALLAGRGSWKAGSWPSAACLFVYALAFSLAYVRLDTGTGALILFGVVQCTMLGWALFRGDRPTRTEWLGWVTALGGLTWLALPGATAPAPGAAALMALAGVAWGVYSLRGAGGQDPTRATAGNFARTVPMVAVAALLSWTTLAGSAQGIGLATGSGAIASGLGYVLWFAALRGLTRTRAAIVQLAVPVLAATAGVLLLGERPTPRLILAGALILGGVAVAVVGRTRPAKRSV